MASADFLRFVVTMLRFEFVYSYAPARPPRVSVITFTSYICCIYALNFGQYRTLFCHANSSISKRLFMQFLFVRPRFCLRLLSDSASRRTPLSLANSSYCHACSGLSPPCCIACRAHRKNGTVFPCRFFGLLHMPIFYLHIFREKYMQITGNYLLICASKW